MPRSIEDRVRRELEREQCAIERLRLEPALLAPALRAEHGEIMADLEAAWERARDAVDALTHAVGDDAARFSAEFGTAWSLLKHELRRVAPELGARPLGPVPSAS